MTLAFDPARPSSWISRPVRFTPTGSDRSYDAVIIEHDASRDNVRHLFKIHILDVDHPYRGDTANPRVMATAEELSDRD